MLSQAAASRCRSARRLIVSLGAILPLLLCTEPGFAAGCMFPPLGDGRVASIVDAMSFRLTDGNEVRLAGIEPVTGLTKADRARALAAIIDGHDVILRGQHDAPDRYGRQVAFVYLKGSQSSVQELLLAQGEAFASPDVADKDCAAALMAAERAARQAKRGIWAKASVIKNAESPDDILTRIGRFTLVEGRVLSVHRAGPTTYLNFGRNWTREFAATISRRSLPAFARAGIVLKSLQNRRIRVRGWIEAHPGPRIWVRQVGQIQVLGGN